MKIIRPGKLPSEKVYQGLCRNCTCLFEFKESEGSVFHDQRDGSFVTINCPTCSQPVHEPWRKTA